MKLYQKVLMAGTTLTLPFVGGCDYKTLDAVVLEEFGTAHIVVDSPEIISENLSKELLREGNLTYGLVIESGGETYTISVYQKYDKSLSALAKAIKPGDKIRVDFGYETKLDEDNIGYVHSQDVSVIEKKN